MSAQSIGLKQGAPDDDDNRSVRSSISTLYTTTGSVTTLVDEDLVRRTAALHVIVLSGLLGDSLTSFKMSKVVGLSFAI